MNRTNRAETKAVHIWIVVFELGLTLKGNKWRVSKRASGLADISFRTRGYQLVHANLFFCFSKVLFIE